VVVLVVLSLTLDSRIVACGFHPRLAASKLAQSKAAASCRTPKLRSVESHVIPAKAGIQLKEFGSVRSYFGYTPSNAKTLATAAVQKIFGTFI
jgi:hypothetical protein